MNTRQLKSTCGVVAGAFGALILAFGPQHAAGAEKDKTAKSAGSGFSFAV